MKDEIRGAALDFAIPVTSDSVGCPTYRVAVHRLLGVKATRAMAGGVREMHRPHAHAGVRAGELDSRFYRESQLRRTRNTRVIADQTRRLEKMR